MTTQNELLTPEQVSEMLKVHVATLERWRFKQEGPKFIKLGTSRRSLIRYKRKDVDDWLLASAK